jgi:hypothetical protein
MLNAALAYIEMGFRVFPVEVKGKKPLIKEWQKKATTDEAVLREWWEKWPKANIGLAAGEESGFFVLDIDTKDDQPGNESFNELEIEVGLPEETLEARTGSGGRHLFYRYPSNRPVRNKQSFRPGLDIRGEGGYVVAAPSIHPDTGQPYTWPYGVKMTIAEAPKAFLDVIAPRGNAQKPPEQPKQPQEPVSSPSARPHATPVIERASSYLKECAPAIEGSGGHDALLWAARAMVIGFELSDTDALNLLWREFNPRCAPPWNPMNPASSRDFERKVSEARKTPGEKPRGWLLDECGLRTDDEALQSLGMRLRDGLLAAAGNATIVKQGKPEPNLHVADKRKVEPAKIDLASPKFVPFPMDVLPSQIAAFGHKLAEAHNVDDSFAGLPMLVVTAAAMGNAFRIKVKEGWEIPPTLWGGIVAAPGQNKTGPLQAILSALRKTPAIDVNDDSMLNPQGRMIYSDVTLEQMINRLAASPRGLCLYRNEFAGWLKSFNAYKRGGGDEQAWLEFWDAHEYQLDRKTNNEDVFIPAASVSIVGGMQPKVLVECFDPGRFASGLVQRVLITHPPRRRRRWSNIEVTVEDKAFWTETITWLRTRPFASLDTNNQQYAPHVLGLTPTARARFIEFFEDLGDEIEAMDVLAQEFASKTDVIGARLALCHHGLRLATKEIDPNLFSVTPVSLESIEAGCELAKWFLNEQVRVYGLANSAYKEMVLTSLVNKINRDFGGSVSVRRFQRSNGRKYKRAQDVKEAMQQLVDAGLGMWDEHEDLFTVKPNAGVDRQEEG